MFSLVLAAATALAPWPAPWIHGAADCAQGRGPMFQVHEAAPDTFVLRMSKCASPEAPFAYLLLGERRALLLDTGDEPVSGRSEIRAVVDRLLEQRNLELVVAHSHGHGDHRGGDALFDGRPRTRVVGMTTEDVKTYFVLPRWPEGEATLDLGGRRLTVLPLPGHQVAHIAVYDPRHRLLLTGDTLYPGLLTIRDWPAFRASALRLRDFVRAHPVDQVLGAHVEMTSKPGVMYPLGTTFQPDEHPLALGTSHVEALAAAVVAMGDTPQRQVLDDFILEEVPAPRAGVHRMLLFGDNAVFASHLPMFRSPHDYQVVLEVELPDGVRRAYVRDRQRTGERVYTLEPEPFVLPYRLQEGAPFKATLYHGHFERGGTPLRSGVQVRIRSVVWYRHLDPQDTGPRDETIVFGRGRAAFAAHRIAGVPDFDQVAAITLADGRPAPARPVALRGGPAPLKEGQRLEGGGLAGTVTRVLYTEHGDLEKP